MTDVRAPGGDHATPHFVFAGLRGRTPEGPPPPRVLDVLVFQRAQARFLGSPAVEPATGDGALPWREGELEDVPRAAGREPAAPEHASEDGNGRAPADAAAGSWQPARWAEASSQPERPASSRRAEPSAQPERPAEPRRDRGAEPPPTIRYRHPVVPGITSPAVSAARAEGWAPSPAAPHTRAAAAEDAPAARAVEPAGTSPPNGPDPGSRDVRSPAQPQHQRQPEAFPFAAPHVVVTGVSKRARPGPGSPARQAADDTRPPAPETSGSAQGLPWAGPALSAPRVGPAVGPFVASPARHAAATAERVARAVSRRESRNRPLAPPESGPARGRGAAHPPEPGRDARPLTTGALLRELTRDDVVRALAARMRALAHEDRFRLGELR